MLVSVRVDRNREVIQVWDLAYNLENKEEHLKIPEFCLIWRKLKGFERCPSDT